jgi:hypothetical protein
MIVKEWDAEKLPLNIDVAVVAVGYEPRCKFVCSSSGLVIRSGLGLTFGFLEGGGYAVNRDFFFRDRGFEEKLGTAPGSSEQIGTWIAQNRPDNRDLKILVDISSMSREMIANVVVAIRSEAQKGPLTVIVAYAPSRFGGPSPKAPIRVAKPVTSHLAGWSTRPDRPLGVIAGLGCEPGLALGALQYLEPDHAWLYRPVGIDPEYDREMRRANNAIEEVFEPTVYDYNITRPSVVRARYAALLRSITPDFRVISLAFGPKMFAWAVLSTIAFEEFSDVGVWTFSSREKGTLVDREANGEIVVYIANLCPQST